MARRAKHHQLYKWVNDNNPPSHLEYAKGWWDYIEFHYRVIAKLEPDEVSVVATYVVETPPPQERLTMPVVVVDVPGASFATRFDFGRNPTRDEREWIVSVKRRAPYTGPLLGLFKADEDLGALPATGLAPEWLFGSYRANPARFTCALRDEWDVWAFLKLLAHEA